MGVHTEVGGKMENMKLNKYMRNTQFLVSAKVVGIGATFYDHLDLSLADFATYEKRTLIGMHVETDRMIYSDFILIVVSKRRERKLEINNIKFDFSSRIGDFFPAILKMNFLRYLGDVFHINMIMPYQNEFLIWSD